MADDIHIGFESKIVELELDQLIPIKPITPAIKDSRKFQQIISSIKEVGIIEPLVVTKDKKLKDRYILLDGNMRLEALKELKKQDKVLCIISKDDESFTYNKYISRQAPIQDHKMIQKAIKNGVSEEKLAKALNINVKSVIQKRHLLDGICDEAIELLKDKMVAGGVFQILKKMKPYRQIEVATMMIDNNAFTVPYAKSLLFVTTDDQLVTPNKPKAPSKTLTPEKQERMQREISALEKEYKIVKDELGSKNLVLQFSKNYLTKLLENSRVTKFLKQHHPDILEEFQRIVDMQSLNDKKI